MTLVEAGPRLLPELPASAAARARRVLATHRIELLEGAAVERVEPGAVVVAGGRRLAAAATVWVTGGVAPGWLAASGLPVDRRGFLLVDRALRSLADPRVFAAGDAATLTDFPDRAKAGVYAVRHAPVLWRSLAAALAGGRPPRYRPQATFLSILNTADGRALLVRPPLVVHARWAWRLKDSIDRRYMRRYR